MKAETAAAIIVAALAVLGSIGSVLLLSLRVGRLIGIMESHIKVSDADRHRLWQEQGKLEMRLERHIEIYHRGVRDVS